MNPHLEHIAKLLTLTSYQANKLRIYSQRYNIGRLEKRGGVLYAPYRCDNLWQWCKCLVTGPRADLIGRDKMLLRAQRKIKFCANGYHSVRTGKYTYYANASGQVVSKHEFIRATRN